MHIVSQMTLFCNWNLIPDRFDNLKSRIKLYGSLNIGSWNGTLQQ